ncbi:bifunctional 3-oxoadipate enol-lactonase/4-carboxymuconolactone decarboxylase PcaDC [Kutzneria buriramensis]|uniref:bifunctional 3-oxoadipate enol-lactonase/4-carboxymuconolactone decarboxylase PcaDC n=1 Tax=Kutzneria buriramensis TaxID=1045776 RepID=UPI003EBD34F4
MGNSLGTTSAMWREQLPALGQTMRLLLIDHPGHGDAVSTNAAAQPPPDHAAGDRSGGEATANQHTDQPPPDASADQPSGEAAAKRSAAQPPLNGSTDQPGGEPGFTPHSIDQLGRRALGILDEAGVERAHFLGLSLGGMVGMWLAANAPERVDRLAVCCTTAYFGTPEPWRQRAAAVRADGMASIAEAVVARWVRPGYDRSWLIDMLSAIDAEGYAACCDALAELDLRPALPSITAPTLVVAGDADAATPVEHARAIADGIPNARLATVPGAHLAPLESPDAVTPLLVEHFTSVRRQVLGDAHVDRAQAATTPFTADFQDFIGRYAWGDIWTRPGLDRRTRSAITLAMLATLQHEDELAMHVRAALRNGLTVEEIKEVLLQVAVYAGVPTANRAFRIADQVLSTLDTS